MKKKNKSAVVDAYLNQIFNSVMPSRFYFADNPNFPIPGLPQVPLPEGLENSYLDDLSFYRRRRKEDSPRVFKF